MAELYQTDLAYIHAAAFETLARGAAEEIVRRLRGATIPVRRVVDVGCGAGPLSAVLAREGFEVTGIDASAEMVEKARGNVPGARFLHASIYETEIEPCDAIVAVGEPLTYHPEGADAEARIGEFFGRAACALTPGGVLIFDFIECGEPPLTARVWSSGEDWAVLVDTVEDAGSRRLIREIQTFRRIAGSDTYRRGREAHCVRVFDCAELGERLTSLGFEVETSRAYGGERLAPRRCAMFATLRL